ncbi:hypothetical protein UA08_06242 [Talaromyces atroroseus]|uniref:Zn(2)-C6 fungal-type domain-containing protein n=1 Tax=Talaromyces atroroseus TaxID=1441469 RepID=A0A225ASR0_TALAT|nr:hypothetical protein UA08_06242 [Talaromyces atroroseus]OKL58639.1 hypothetical protein UA08_06242 [Talaromyces atroroseus]
MPAQIASPESLISSGVGGTERRRGPRACYRCRISKARCGSEWPRCRRCQLNGTECQYMPSKRKRRRETPLSLATCGDAGEPRTSDDRRLEVNNHRIAEPALLENPSYDQQFLESHVQAFFEYLYPIPAYRFIHKGLFLRSFYQNQVDPLLLQCVCGVAARFIRPRRHQQDKALDYAQNWLKQAEVQTWQRIGEMKIQTLQTMLLLICWHSIERNISSVWILSGVVARIAFGMRLNYEVNNNRDSLVVREIRRRVMWSIFILDKFYAGGFSDVTLCPVEAMHIQLPCQERSFELEIPVETCYLNIDTLGVAPDYDRNTGTMGNVIRMVAIRHRILQRTKQIISAKENPYNSRTDFEDIENILEKFMSNLPSHLRYTPNNLIMRAYTPELTEFVILHTLWHLVYCDLFRMMVPGIRESVPQSIHEQIPGDWADSCRHKCLQHAVAACEFLSDVLQHADIERVTDPIAAICVYQCANIIANLWDLDRNVTGGGVSRIRQLLSGMDSFLDHLALLYPIVPDMQTEIRNLIADLDTVTEQYYSQSHAHSSQTLTALWREKLRSRGGDVGQTTSKFSYLEALEKHNSPHKADRPGNVDTEASTVSASTDVTPGSGEIALDLLEGMMDGQEHNSLPEFFFPMSTNIDLACFETRVDPFYRIVDDWSQ